MIVRRAPACVAAAMMLGLTGGPGEAAETIPLHDRAGELIGALDLDVDGCVLGIELLDAAHRLPRPRDV